MTHVDASCAHVAAWCYTEKATPARHRPERQYNARAKRWKQCSPNMLLHGALKDLMVHAIVSDVDAAMVAQFSPYQRRALTVRLAPSAMILLVAAVVLLIVAAQSGYCRIYRRGSLCYTVSPGGILTSATT